jgi:hypothetical protein
MTKLIASISAATSKGTLIVIGQCEGLKSVLMTQLTKAL